MRLTESDLIFSGALMRVLEEFIWSHGIVIVHRGTLAAWESWIYDTRMFPSSANGGGNFSQTKMAYGQESLGVDTSANVRSWDSLAAIVSPLQISGLGKLRGLMHSNIAYAGSWATVTRFVFGKMTRLGGVRSPLSSGMILSATGDKMAECLHLLEASEFLENPRWPIRLH